MKTRQEPVPRALVTGAAGGIGWEIARRLHAAGYRLTLVDIDEAVMRARVSGLADVDVIAADLSDQAVVADLSTRIATMPSLFDVAFINAGVIVPGYLVDLSDEAIDRQLAVNLRTAIHLIRACARQMVQHRRGHIVATVSVGGIVSLKGSAVYSASKFGLRGFLMGIREELAPHGVAVSGIYPSGVDTRMLRMEARHGGSALNFVSTPQSVQAVGDAFFRALKTGRLEVYQPYADGLLSRLVALAPWTMRRLYPLLERIGEAGRRRYLASIEHEQ